MDPIKSIAVPATRRRGSGKPKRAGHPAPLAENRVGGPVGPLRRQPGPAQPRLEPRYAVGQRLTLLGGGNHWARAQGLCRVIAVMPHETGPFQYRVRSEAENYERIVAEADLEPAL